MEQKEYVKNSFSYKESFPNLYFFLKKNDSTIIIQP